MACYEGKNSEDKQLSQQQQRKPWVLLHGPILPESVEKMKNSYNVICMWEGDEWKQSAASIEALVTYSKLSEEFLESLPSLRIIANHAIGVDNVDLEYCRRRSIRVTNTPDVVTADVADLAVLLMLAVQRRLFPSNRFLRQGLWHHRLPPIAYKASGLRVGIVGLGRIGRAIAKRVESFDCTVSYNGRTKKSDVTYAYYSNLMDLATDSDVLIVACALTEETTHIISREVINALGAYGTLVNIARGAVIDEVELVKALQEKRLGAAALDVFEHEPNVPSELLNMDNVVLTPHIGTASVETRRAMCNLIQDNLDSFFSGRELVTPVV